MNQNKIKNSALAIDTSTNEYPKETIKDIINLINKTLVEIPMIFADFKIRQLTTTKEKVAIPYKKHGKGSYTDVLEWCEENEVNQLYYITDLTGYIWDDIEVNYDVTWLVPFNFKPKPPFGEVIQTY
ncbi:VWA-like domain-containing protein [Tuberibacillus sp. Marseille-P3662]|uniref:VWA-like domain-containing protein n=1 Tax=Tuberibacillus sp. Marseille-P3662 TaxID=1965358 RepID=UPI000A1CE11A|nr:VWA-like domain-containing protein [Tuberibacillus sp. Marseille-P3662]